MSPIRFHKQPFVDLVFFEFVTITWDLNDFKLRKRTRLSSFKTFCWGWAKQSFAQSLWRDTAKNDGFNT